MHNLMNDPRNRYRFFTVIFTVFNSVLIRTNKYNFNNIKILYLNLMKELKVDQLILKMF